MKNETKKDPASFRDPAATVYIDSNKVIRMIYPSYYPEYDLFMDKIYPELINQNLIIPHMEMTRTVERIIISPELVPFISYSYEWSFAMLKEAALVTLRVNQIALEHGMMLKDASVYNVQYYQGRMRLIDTTSFTFYSGDTPWPAYSQFLRHFVTPLLWIKYSAPDMRRLSEIYLDGIPVPLTKHMLPFSSRLNNGVMLHIVSQSWSDLFTDPKRRTVKMTRTQLTALLNHLYNFILRLNYHPVLDRGWLKYAEAGSYSTVSLNHKREIVNKLLEQAGGTVLDLGANTGDYSRIATAKGASVVAVDADHDCMFFLHDTPNVLPLIVDLCNPSPGIGWANRERRSFWDRVGVADTILALALIHHLSIRNNVPLELVADLLAEHCKRLIIEWIPIKDKQAQRLLKSKQIPPYNLDVFDKVFNRRFDKTYLSFPITGSDRVIYLMERE